MSKTQWHLKGEEVGGCNCDWGCPCQFNANPTHGDCHGLGAMRIEQGHYGETRLDGLRFVLLLSWPGAIADGDGTMQVIIDNSANEAQRAALKAIVFAEAGGMPFEIFSAVCPHKPEPLVAPIDIESDRERRTAVIGSPGILEVRIEPIKNPVTGEEHRARIVLPNGFEYQEAEVGNTVSLNATAAAPLTFEHQNTYAQLNAFDWTNAG